MQLIRPALEQLTEQESSVKVATMVAFATSCLLATASVNASESDFSKRKSDWTTQGAVLSYSENGRITVNQALVKVKKEDERGSLQFQVGYDVVSGPSENGAMPRSTPQIFTSPSGREEYVVPAGELPWYEIERHPRKEISVSKSNIFGSEYSINYGARYSTEATYESRSINGGFTVDTNQKNTQYSLSMSYEDATIRPYGGVAVPLSRVITKSEFADTDAFNEAWNHIHLDQRKSRETLSISTGVTQVVNRNTLMQFYYTYTDADGYQNDSQKMVSVIDAGGDVLYNIYENRPEERRRESVLLKGLFSLDDARVLDIDYRYYWDDWSVQSWTFSAGVQLELDRQWKIEPQFRWYKQSSSSFFKHALFSEAAHNHNFLSADYRLAETTNYTLGLNADYYQSNGNVTSLRFAWYNMRPRRSNDDLKGYLQTVDVNRDISATMISVGYEF